MRLRKKYAVYGAFTLLMTFLLGEFFARGYFGLGTPPLFISHPTIEYLYQPNQDVNRFGRRFITNEYGMRSDSFARKKGGNETRIMVFGDSVVNGASQTGNDNLATTLLARELSDVSDETIVVGNISAGSWGPGNWLAYAKEYGFFDADIIVLVTSSHDSIDNPLFHSLDPITHPTKRPLSALVEGTVRYLPRYLLMNWSKIRTRNILEEQESLFKPETESDVSQGLNKEVVKGLSDLKIFLELAKEQAKYVVVFQFWGQAELNKKAADPGNKFIRQVTNQLGIDTISLQPYFQRSLDAGRNPYQDNYHPNDIGQHMISEAIYKTLISRPVVK